MVTGFSGDKVTAAVITGAHAFDVAGFHWLLRSLPDIDFYLQDLDNFAHDRGGVRQRYDVVIFYNSHRPTPGTSIAAERRVRDAIEQLGETRQGILVWHHALLAYPQWPLWSTLCGIDDRTGYVPAVGERVAVEIADPTHPVTQHLQPWEMVDEVYAMPGAGDDSNILLVTAHPKSMRTLAWTRRHKAAPVFCLQPGHDNLTYAHPTFQTVLYRGILWLAGRLAGRTDGE